MTREDKEMQLLKELEDLVNWLILHRTENQPIHAIKLAIAFTGFALGTRFFKRDVQFPTQQMIQHFLTKSPKILVSTNNNKKRLF